MILNFAVKAKVLSMVLFAVSGAAAWAQPQYLISTVAGGGAPATPALGVKRGLPRGAGAGGGCRRERVLLHRKLGLSKLDAAGILTRVAGGGSPFGLGDGGLAVNARLSSPEGVTVDAAGQIYVSDTGNHRVPQDWA